VSFTQTQACAEDFVERFTGACRKAAPLMELLSRAVGVPW
jgi:transglutaminase-like putative cysteine protease